MYQSVDWWDNIPPEVKQYPHFMVCGRDKVPRDPQTGYMVGKDDPSNWLSWGDAEYFAGENDYLIGFCPRPDDPFVIIDLDGKKEYGTEDQQVRERLLAWAIDHTYVERSSSGNGYHILIKGSLLADINKGARNGIEAYANRGFVILTGNCISRTREIISDQATCDWLNENYRVIGDAQPEQDYYSLDQQRINNPDSEELRLDQEFIDKASTWSNRAKLEHLWNAQDTDESGRGGSEGDLSIMQFLWKFNKHRPHPDECAIRMFVRSPRARKLARKGTAWSKYLMTTLRSAKGRVALDESKTADFSVGANAMLEQFQKERADYTAAQTQNAMLRAQGVPVPAMPAFTPTFKFDFLKPDEIVDEPPLKWALENVFLMQSVNAIYGWSGVGKSFIALDLMMAIAQGKEWFGHETEQMRVSYLALEGGEGMRNRLKAYKVGNEMERLPENLEIYRGKFNMRDEKMIAAFIDARLSTRTDDSLPEMVVIDTFAKAIPGADENSAADMGAAVQAAELIKEKLNACVIIVHHSTKPNKDTGKAGGLRGSGAIQAGIDGVIEVAKMPLVSGEDEQTKEPIITGYKRFLDMNKVKEGLSDRQLEFELDIVDIENRTRKSGEIVPVTSCRIIDLQDTSGSNNPRAVPPVANAPVGGSTYTPAERASGNAQSNFGGGRKSTGRGRKANNGNPELIGLDYQGKIQDALTIIGNEARFANMRGMNGAPEGKVAIPRKELITKVVDLLNANVDPKDRELLDKITDALTYARTSKKIGQSTEKGAQFIWKL